MLGEFLSEHVQILLDAKENILIIAVGVFACYLVLFFKGVVRCQEINIRSVMPGILLSLSIGAILALTLMGREYNPYSQRFELEVFWSYKKAMFEKNSYFAVEIVCNILLFIPWGFMMPFLFKWFEKLTVLFVAAVLFSLCIELTQGIFCLGLFEFDDIINNVLGAVTGWTLFRKMKKT